MGAANVDRGLPRDLYPGLINTSTVIHPCSELVGWDDHIAQESAGAIPSLREEGMPGMYGGAQQQGNDCFSPSPTNFSSRSGSPCRPILAQLLRGCRLTREESGLEEFCTFQHTIYSFFHKVHIMSDSVVLRGVSTSCRLLNALRSGTPHWFTYTSIHGQNLCWLSTFAKWLYKITTDLFCMHGWGGGL